MQYLDEDNADDQLPILDLLASIREAIRQLHQKTILKSGLYEYLIDLIEEEADIIREEVRVSLNSLRR